MSSPFITQNGGSVIDTTRSYPRTMRSAFPLDYRESAIGISGPPVIRLYTPMWLRLWDRVKESFK
jgi:hypothetical protein